MFSRYLETIIIFGTFNRKDVAEKSFESLYECVKNFNTKIIVVDSSSNENKFFINKDCDYLWLPGDVSMAMARNIGYQYFKEKYVSDWILFVEDDLEYKENWYEELVSFASRTYGKKSPNQLIYGCFSASPGIKNDDTVVFDSENNCYCEFFGPRADQRLYKTSHYNNINIKWDNDLLGISSFQTGTQIHRNTMRGYCSGNISQKNLCKFLEEEESTWIGQRDIGPAAFDKRMEGYSSTLKRVETLMQGSKVKGVAKIKPQNAVSATQITFDKKIKKNNFFSRTKSLIRMYLKK